MPAFFYVNYFFLNYFLFLFISDINECEEGTYNCSSNAVCNNTKGSYTCTSKPGYEEDGNNYTGNLLSNLRSGAPSSLFVLDARVKGRPIHLLSASSARSPESGLLSDWSKNKRAFRAAHRLVTRHLSDFRCNQISFVTCFISSITET